jgi:hypothetical protein
MNQFTLESYIFFDMQIAGSTFLRNVGMPPDLQGFTTEKTGLFIRR